MKVEITGGEKKNSGLYVDSSGDVWCFNEQADGLCVSCLEVRVWDFDEANNEYGPLTYFTGTVTLTND